MAISPNVQEMLQIRSAGYRPPMAYRPTFSQSGLPPFTLTTVEWMRRDPQVQLGMAIKAAPFHKVKLTIKGDPSVTQFMADQIRRFWQRAIPKILNGFWYTVSGGEISYKINELNGRYEFWQYTDVYPTDLAIISSGLVPVGITIRPQGTSTVPSNMLFDQAFGGNAPTQTWNNGKPLQLLFPKGFIYIHRREFNSLIGRSEFESAYETWLEKSDYQGAKHSRKLWFFKNAFGGGFLFHPEGSYQTETGEQIPYRDLARQALETAMNGAVWCFENKRDPVTGEPLWNYVEPKINPGGSELLNYVNHLDNEIMRGLGIPDDVVQQVSGTGSYSGRTIPLTAFLISHESLLDNLFNVCDEQVFRPLCKANFGHDHYEATMDVDIDAIIGNVDPNMRDTNNAESAANEANGVTVPSQMSNPGTTLAYYGTDYRDPFHPHVRCQLIGPYGRSIAYLPNDTCTTIPTQMSAQHLGAGQQHQNKSGKTSKGGQFTDGQGSGSREKTDKKSKKDKKAKKSKTSDPHAARVTVDDLSPEDKAKVKDFMRQIFGEKTRANTKQKVLKSRSKKFTKSTTISSEPRNIPKQEPKSDKAKLALASHVLIDKRHQQYADTVEAQHAKALGGVSFKNSESVDIVIAGKDGQIEHVVEWKTMVVKSGNERNRIDINSYAQVRKINMEKKNKCNLHTIICDDRDVAVETKDGSFESKNVAKRVYYYRRGCAGSARLSALQKCDSLDEVKALMVMPENKLPKGAQRTDGEKRQGTWKPVFHPTTGRNGFANTKTGETYYAKK